MKNREDYDIDTWFGECPDKFKAIADLWAKPDDPMAMAIRDRFGWEVTEFYNQYCCDMYECESPIEKQFLEALYAQGPAWGRPIESCANDLHHVITTGEPCNPAIYVFPQRKIKLAKEYRVDFLIICKPNPTKPLTLKVVVECDGHDYHERTKDQAKRDKQRDRDFTQNGFTVFRFTGSEIHNDALKCALEVIKFCDRGPK